MDIFDIKINDNAIFLIKLEESFINDYNFWKNSINNINKGITMYNDSDENLYEYDEFCIMFIQLINEKISTIPFSRNLVNQILTIMMKMKYKYN